MSRLIEPNCTFFKDSFKTYLEVNADEIAKTWRIDDVIVAPSSPTSADLIAIVWHPDSRISYWELASREHFPVNKLFITPQVASRHDKPLEYFDGVMTLLAEKGFTVEITYWPTHKFVESLPRAPSYYSFKYMDNELLWIEATIEMESACPYKFTVHHDHEQGVCNCWELLAHRITTETRRCGFYSVYMAFERNLSQEDLDTLIEQHNPIYFFIGEWPDDWFHSDGTTETFKCSVYAFQCPANLIRDLQRKIENLDVPKVWPQARVFSLIDHVVPWPFPPISSTAPVKVHWMTSAPLRPRFLTSRVIDIVIALHTFSLPRYEMMEILLCVPCIYLLPRRELDYLVESLYKSIHKVTMFKTGPCRSTRRQLSIKR